MKFKLVSKHKPAGDQIKAINKLHKSLSDKSYKHTTLLGVTGSGKTFTTANVIEKINKPVLVIAHNKTLAAQLAQEYKEFFPNNSVHYFVSYYDYYQPEAYVPISDTYISKEVQINAEIDRLRHDTTQSLLLRKDVIVVASVSAIYGLGSPEEYKKVHLKVTKNKKITREDFIKKAIKIFFERVPNNLSPGKLTVIGNKIEIMPVNKEIIYQIFFDFSTIKKIISIDPFSREIISPDIEGFFLFPAKHFISDESKRTVVIEQILTEYKKQLAMFKRQGKFLEADRLKHRTLQDIALIREIGYCNGIENYSRFFDKRKEGEAPNTLLSYFPKDFLTIIDESHVTLPQISGMYAGDRARKKTLINFGFRLPSAFDNRPLTFDEFNKKTGQMLYLSATPSAYEIENSTEQGGVVEQIIRPTGLVDPEILVKPITATSKNEGQVVSFIKEAKKEIKNKGRILATTLTKKSAEDLSSFMSDNKFKSKYIHSEIKTIERTEILTDFRRGKFDVLIGVNLLREGLDLPEVTLVAVFDADKEGFLRTKTSLIQTIGRAARNQKGRVILYADVIGNALAAAISETKKRREIQQAYNKKHKITPITIRKEIKDIREEMNLIQKRTTDSLLKLEMDKYKRNPRLFIKEKKEAMERAVEKLDFETAAILRDEIIRFQEQNSKKK